jgi:fimbrial isopeptide formation D2 family protein
VRSNSFGQARAAVSGVVLALFAGLAGLALPPVHAQSASVVNTATVAPPDGVNDIDPGNDSDSATVTIAAAADYGFCAAPGLPNAIFSINNGVQIWRYDYPGGTPTQVAELDQSIAGTLNALMLDAVNDRLLFHSSSGAGTLWAYDAGNGGWYEAATVSGTFPRAGMRPDGTGYLIQGGSNTPAVFQVTPQAAGYGYDVVSLGNLTYDFVPTGNNSGDIAFDADGIAWITTGLDLYRIDFSQPGAPVAQRQTRPLLNGNPSTVDWAGVAFADNGDMIMASLAGASYAYDFATGNLTPVASFGVQSRDLASCAFPQIGDPDLSVVKTLAEVNGVAYDGSSQVHAGDTLTWHIEITNAGGVAATLYPGTPGDVGETVPVGTTHAGGDDFTCAGTVAGSTCSITGAVNIPGNGGSAILAFRATVDDPLPAGLSSIANAVTFPNDDIDCAAAGNDCEEITPLGPATSVVKTSSPGTGTAVAAGDSIAYTLTVTVANAATNDAITLTDTLGAGLTLDGALPAGCSAAGQVVTCVLAAGAAVGTHSFDYSATVDADATGTVGNVVVASVPPGGTDPEPDCTSCETEHPLQPATSVAKVSDPASGATVSPGDSIAYTLTVTVANAATNDAITLTDTLGAGLTLDGALPAGCSAAGQVVTCVLAAGAAVGTHTFDYTASASTVAV